MPFKSETTFNEIYLNNGDDFIPLKGIEDVKIDTEFSAPELIDTTTLHDGYISGCRGSITFDHPITRYEGIRIARIMNSNNWLKMHGLPMIRKTVAERRRKRWIEKIKN